MRCAVYIRVSTNKEEQKTSLVSQRELFIQYVGEREWDIYDFYVDVDSGTISKRSSLQRLIKDAEEKKFDVILAKELSRLARNGGLSYQIRDIAQANNIHIITLDNAIDTTIGNMDKFGLYAWLYEEESQRTSIRVKRALNTKAQRGEFKGSIPPLGYEVKDGKLYVRKDATSDIIRRIFRDYLAGKGFDRIARELFEEGIPTPSQIAGKSNCGDKWHGSTVRKILENPHYAGDLVQGRSTTKSVTVKSRKYNNPNDFIVVPNSHEAIVSKKDFETVQQLINSRKRTRPQAELHLFTNTAYCADCGRGMHFKKNCKGYVCGNYNKHGITACNDHLTRESDLILAILNDIQTLASNLNNEKIFAKLEAQLNKQKQYNEQEIKNLDKKLEKLKNRKRKAQDEYYDEEISKKEYNEYINSVNLEINDILKSKQALEESIKSQDDMLAFTELKENLEQFLSFKKLTPEMLHTLIDRIEIKADGSPRIFYRFSNPSAYSLILSINAQHST
ncbi:recombinase family protein [Heyndrickxia sp. NPDC080065]|uniref:recombinase family protein n=1 Tax=Heyndrickxia sp. NPDC080065 TaxID=3390568 RepID=UPI003D050E23